MFEKLMRFLKIMINYLKLFEKLMRFLKIKQ